MQSRPLVSIIIPCFNSGSYLADAINSVRQQDGRYSYDIIIVDDGSTDDVTKEILEYYKKQQITVVHQENKGPAAARNTGVRTSGAKYLLFLDSDNKIRPNYISKAVSIFEKDEKVGVVYGAPFFFGDSSEVRFTPAEFNIYTIIHKGHSIDMCAVVRREVWNSVGGFDENMLLIGHEDWDFWIMAGAKGWKFSYIKEVLYDYRVRHDSLISNANHRETVEKVLTYFYIKHRDTLLYNYDKLYNTKLFYENEHKNPFRLFLKYFFRKFFA